MRAQAHTLQGSFSPARRCTALVGGELRKPYMNAKSAVLHERLAFLLDVFFFLLSFRTDFVDARALGRGVVITCALSCAGVCTKNRGIIRSRVGKVVCWVVLLWHALTWSCGADLGPWPPTAWTGSFAERTNHATHVAKPGHDKLSSSSKSRQNVPLQSNAQTHRTTTDLTRRLHKRPNSNLEHLRRWTRWFTQRR